MVKKDKYSGIKMQTTWTPKPRQSTTTPAKAIPTSAYGTSSAEHGQVSQTGKVEATPAQISKTNYPSSSKSKSSKQAQFDKVEAEIASQPALPDMPDRTYGAGGQFEHSAFSYEGAKERWLNVENTLDTAMGFKPGGITANTDSDGLNKVLEWGAEHPFQTAAIATGVVGAGKWVVGKIGASAASTAYGATTGSGPLIQMAQNTKTLGLTMKVLGTGGKVVKAIGITAIIGSYPFSWFIKEEAHQQIGLAISDASWNGDMVGWADAIKQQEEMFTPSMLRKITNTIPIGNLAAAFKDFFKTARIKLDISKRQFAVEQEKIATGMTDVEVAQRRAAEEATMYEDANIRKIGREEAQRERNEASARAEFLWKQNQGDINREEDEASARAEMEASGKFWADQDIKQKKRDAQERKDIAAYWLEYDKIKAEMDEARQAQSTSGGYEAPSQLGFGLL